MNWTKQQKLAIDTTQGRVLVTASAGTGKTAVLVQRCLSLLSRGEDPCDIRQLLALTFTEAAATEMRTRIRDELIRLSRHNSRYRQQLVLIDQAQISTIHSFCQSILREYFHRLGLDPDFEILQDDETQLLRLQIAEQLLEDRYAQLEAAASSATLRELNESYGWDLDDRPLVQLLTRLYGFLETMREHEGWLTQLEESGQTEKLVLIRRQKETLLGEVRQIQQRLAFAEGLFGHLSPLNSLKEYIQGTLKPQLDELAASLETKDFDQVISDSRLWQFPRAPSKKKGEDTEQREQVKKQVDQARDQFNKLGKTFLLDEQVLTEQLRRTGPMLALIGQLEQEFVSRYRDSKQRQNVLDFADLEQLCFQLLQGPEGATDIARDYQKRFRYVLVDEYQDISPIQDAIIDLVCPQGGNLFVVGDVKQSIYSFRHARPEIFLDKYHSYEPTSDEKQAAAKTGRRIDLKENFRSRRGVIEGVNYLFGRMMVAGVSGIDYATESQLEYGADYYHNADGDVPDQWPVEVHLIESTYDSTEDTDNESSELGGGWFEMERVRREAMIVGRRIQEMIGSGSTILDPENGRVRPVSFRDIAILLRSVRSKLPLWLETFAKLGIPVQMDSSGSFLEATEIRDMICLLEVLDNPQQDIALASVLRGPLGRFNETELLTIRRHDMKETIYHALVSYQSSGQDETLRGKVGEFLCRLDRWRGLARRGKLSDVIWKIYRQSQLLAYVQGLPEGRQRYRNLLYFHQCARQFGRFARQGLTRFLRFIREKQEEQNDFGPARSPGQTDNAVGILSIHKSKGLEFPVVIVADLSGRFNRTDFRQSVLFSSCVTEERDRGFGVGLKMADRQNRVSWPSLSHSILSQESQHRQLAEEMRLLYVAFTRARERLVLVGTADLERCRKKWDLWRASSEGVLPEFSLSEASCPLDWIGPSLAGHADMKSFFPAPGTPSGSTSVFSLQIYTEEQIKEQVDSFDREKPADKQRVSPEKEDLSQQDQDTIEEVLERVNWQYPYQAQQKVPARYSVTELKNRLAVGREDENPSAELAAISTDSEELLPAFDRQPRFMTDERETVFGWEKGSWTHLFLQKVDLAGPLDRAGLTEQMKDIVKKGFLLEREAGQVDLGQIERFFACPVGKQMQQYREPLYREWPFTLAVPVSRVYPEQRDNGPEDQVLIRGQIDCLYKTGDGWVIVDFKTDRIRPEQCPERAEKYAVQMSFYQEAVETILCEAVSEVYVYFLAAGECQRMKDRLQG